MKTTLTNREIRQWVAFNDDIKIEFDHWRLVKRTASMMGDEVMVEHIYDLWKYEQLPEREGVDLFLRKVSQYKALWRKRCRREIPPINFEVTIK